MNKKITSVAGKLVVADGTTSLKYVDLDKIISVSRDDASQKISITLSSKSDIEDLNINHGEFVKIYHTTKNTETGDQKNITIIKNNGEISIISGDDNYTKKVGEKASITTLFSILSKIVDHKCCMDIFGDMNFEFTMQFIESIEDLLNK